MLIKVKSYNYKHTGNFDIVSSKYADPNANLLSEIILRNYIHRY